jgi:hypothetical protein
LILSTFQDGTGMLRIKGRSLPGWRDFERAVAIAVGGTAQESKAVFDVQLTAPAAERRPRYGVSCKMRSELRRIERDGRVTIEVSNAASEFTDAVRAAGVAEDGLSHGAAAAGTAIASVVRGWHNACSHHSGGDTDVEKSCYLVLLWDRATLDYQLFQFRLDLWDPAGLVWSVPQGARRLCGHDGKGNLIEWYFGSGGQLKLYPLAAHATWQSARFQLEPLPPRVEPMAARAASYFPAQWAAASS